MRYLLLFPMFLFLLWGGPFCAWGYITQEKTLLVADFDMGSPPNNLGGDFGAWDKDPTDDTQEAFMDFVNDDALGDPNGFSVRIYYDVDSPNTAYNGFWMKLGGLDASSYNRLRFYIRGADDQPFTKRVKVELKDMSGNTGVYMAGMVTKEWQRMEIPFYRFRKVQQWQKLKELVLVFDDKNSDPKEGAILIDQIELIRR